jgi:hypothetical protein
VKQKRCCLWLGVVLSVAGATSPNQEDLVLPIPVPALGHSEACQTPKTVSITVVSPSKTPLLRHQFNDASPQSESSFLTLPFELRQYVLSLMGSPALGACSLTCKTLCREVLWSAEDLGYLFQIMGFKNALAYFFEKPLYQPLFWKLFWHKNRILTQIKDKSVPYAAAFGEGYEVQKQALASFSKEHLVYPVRFFVHHELGALGQLKTLTLVSSKEIFLSPALKSLRQLKMIQVMSEGLSLENKQQMIKMLEGTKVQIYFWGSKSPFNPSSL